MHILMAVALLLVVHLVLKHVLGIDLLAKPLALVVKLAHKGLDLIKAGIAKLAGLL